MWRICSVSLFLLGLLMPATLSGQSQAPVIPRPVRIANAVRVDRSPKMDGTLDDPLWKVAEPVTSFAQRESYEGQPPTERTEVRILYTKAEIYFGISCFDSEPQKIVATQLRRDISQELDDYFEIVIDSSHNRRNAYLFQFNPLGPQHDAFSRGVGAFKARLPALGVLNEPLCCSPLAEH